MLILAILNDGTIMTISKDRVKPSPYPNSWNLSEIFTIAIFYGIYLAASTIVFFAVIVKTSFFQDHFGVDAFPQAPASSGIDGYNYHKLHSIIYLQVSTISQALIFITRSRGLFFMERPSLVLVCAFVLAQLIATFIAVYATWGFTEIEGCGWAWAAIVWVWNVIWFFPLDLVKVTANSPRPITRIVSLSLSLFAILVRHASLLRAEAPTSSRGNAGERTLVGTTDQPT